MSVSHSWFGASRENCRATRSLAAASLFCGPRRLRLGAGNPWMPRRRIQALTAFWLTVMPYPRRAAQR